METFHTDPDKNIAIVDGTRSAS